MNIQEISQFPFIPMGIMLLLIAIAIQILRGKLTLTGGFVELAKANKGMFDEATDPLVVYLAKMARQSPEETQRSLEWLFLIATGQPLNPQARATLAESTAQKQLKDVDTRHGWNFTLPTGNFTSTPGQVRASVPETRQFETIGMLSSEGQHVPSSGQFAPYQAGNDGAITQNNRFWTEEQRRIPQETPALSLPEEEGAQG
jgi:uncharacterized cupin superfamily protein